LIQIINEINLLILKDGPNCLKKILELKQTLSLVYNTDLFLKQALNDQTVWTFMNVFSQKLDSICPIADLSNIYMDLGSNGVTFLFKLNYYFNINIIIYVRRQI